MGIFSSIFGAAALKKSGKQALAAQEEGYNETKAMYEPANKFGLESLGAYKDAIGIGDSDAAIANFQKSPLYRLQYDAAMKSGQEGVANMANAAGMRNSGRTLMALSDNARRITNNTFSQYMNPLASGADTGLGVTNALANLRMGNANAQADYFRNKGQIKAGQFAGLDNALTGFAKLAGGYF